MSEPSLRSARHPELQRLRALGSSAAARREAGLFVVEGPHAIAEALDAGAWPRRVLASARLGTDRHGPGLVERLEEGGLPPIPVSEKVLERCAPTLHGRGVVALFALPADASDPAPALCGQGPALLALGVQDPGNLGSLVRTAEALGAAGLVADGGSADPWGPKAARASAGALVRFPVARVDEPAAIIGAARAAGRSVVATVPRGGEAPAALRGGSVALLLGAEGRGLPPELVDGADRRVTVPLAPDVDSLGVAAAAAILLYEATRRPAD